MIGPWRCHANRRPNEAGRRTQTTHRTKETIVRIRTLGALLALLGLALFLPARTSATDPCANPTH